MVFRRGCVVGGTRACGVKASGLVFMVALGCAALQAGQLARAAQGGAQATQAAPATKRALTAGTTEPGSPARLDLNPCHVKGVPNEVSCGVLPRPLDPDQPQGVSINIHVAVLPAVARNKLPDPIFFFAGGPGQSAIELAGTVQTMLARFGNRRDIVLIDQRGTGQSAPLNCERPDPWQSLAESANEQRALQRLQTCATALKALPHGDLRFYGTSIAMADAEAVRAALGAEQVNLIGISYGTRAALEYMRLHPQRVRSMVLDGVAPPDMRLARAFSVDNQAALDAMLADCERDKKCQSGFPSLRESWRALLLGLPKLATLTNSQTGLSEPVTVTRRMVLSAVRGALYVPSRAAMLPAAIDAAARGQFAPLLASSFLARDLRLAEGMHFAVACAEDAPGAATAGTDTADAGEPAPGKDFGDEFERLYARICESWPRGKVSDDFYKIGAASAPTLVLSGGADPATPPRHGERVAKLLGPRAAHHVVPQAGHGLLAYACVRDLVYRFVDGAHRTPAPDLSLACASSIPRASVYRPPVPGRTVGSAK